MLFPIIQLLLLWQFLLFSLSVKAQPLSAPTLFKCPSGHIPDEVLIVPWTLVFSELDESDALEFNLTQGVPQQCSGGLIEHVVPIVNHPNTTNSTESNHWNEFYWAPNGYFETRFDAYHPHSYCISNISSEAIKVRTCVPDCKNSTSNFGCVKKCCELGIVVSANLDSPTGGPICNHPSVPEEYYESKLSFYKKPQLKIHYSYSLIWESCPEGVSVITENKRGKPYKYAKIRLLQDGSVQTRISGNHEWETRSTQEDHSTAYCVDQMESEHPDDNFKNDVAVLVCTKKKPRNFTTYIYFSVFIVASGFSAVTVIVYLLLWDMQNLHGWTVATFAGCSFAFLTLAAFEHGVGLFRFMFFESTICKIIAIGGNFAYVGMFAWSTVLAFDLWSAVRTLGPKPRLNESFVQWLYYACFGFGAPLLVVGIGCGIEAYFDEMDDRVFRPQYGRVRCGVDSSSIFYYMLIPTLILYIINIIIATLMVNTLLQFRNVRNNVRSGAARGNSTATLYVKLFILMGVSWGFEFVSYMAKSKSWVWIIFDVVNLLQAVGVFVIFVCKAEVKQQLSRKYRVFRACFGAVEEHLGKPVPTERDISLRTTHFESRMSAQENAYS